VLKSVQLDDASGAQITPSLAKATSATVLIGFAEASAAPEVVWSLIDDGFNVLAFARRGKASALRHSRHVTCHDICAPESDVQKSLSDLRALLSALSAEPGSIERILFPLDDTAVWLCRRMQPDQGWRSAGPQGSCADLALNKQLQTELAREAGFNVPKSLVVRTADDVFRLMRTEPFPIVLKPVECVPVGQGRVQKGKSWICANSQELKQAVTEWAEHVPLLAQPFISGTGEGVFGFATSCGIHSWSAHRRLRMMNPHGSGSSACVSQIVDQEIRSRAEDLICQAHWSGLFMIELLRDDSGTPWFVELNGRPWGSMALSRRQGFEYPAWQARLAQGQNPQVGRQPSLTPGVVCRHTGRELMHLLFVLRGPKSKALRNWPSFWKAVGNVFRMRWKDALYNWRREDPKVFIADIYYTLRDNLIKSGN
jgi:hypothetical protein